MISSPCIKKCLVDMEFQVCMGCGRDMVDIEVWEVLTEETRQRIMNCLPARLTFYKDKKAERNTFDISRLVHNCNG